MNMLQTEDSLQTPLCINEVNPSLEAPFIDWFRAMQVLNAITNNDDNVIDDTSGELVHVKFAGIFGIHGKGRTQEVIWIPDDKQSEGQFSFKVRPIRLLDGIPYLSSFEIGDEVVLKGRTLDNAIEHYNHQQHFYAQKQILAKLDMEK